MANSLTANKFVAFFLLMVAPLHADELADRLASVPNPQVVDKSWVADPAGVIASRAADINRLIAGLESENSAEIAVVVLPTIGHLVPRNFATALFEHWAIGKARQDNGVLVLHVLDQRRIEIETGYGMEGTLPDVKCHWITEEIAVPFFKQNSFADGHYEVVRALARAIRQPEIRHADLVAGWESQPGATINELPTIRAYDDISLEYASVGKKVVYSSWAAPLLIGLAGIFYLMVTAVHRRRSKDKEPYVRYQLFSSASSRLQYLSALPLAAAAFVFEYAQRSTFFAAIPLLLASSAAIFWRRSSALKALRDTPRTCKCGRTMRRLAETQDDAYIDKGKVAEETIGSMDYDVWVCECGKSNIEPYRGKTSADTCDQCHFRTYRVTNTRVLRAATTATTGLRETTQTCANCEYRKVDTEIIPQVSTPSSSSGRSGSSGGSFGGGRSGGGGAGSRY